MGVLKRGDVFGDRFLLSDIDIAQRFRFRCHAEFLLQGPNACPHLLLIDPVALLSGTMRFRVPLSRPHLIHPAISGHRGFRRRRPHAVERRPSARFTNSIISKLSSESPAVRVRRKMCSSKLSTNEIKYLKNGALLPYVLYKKYPMGPRNNSHNTLATPSRGLAHLVMLGQFYNAAARSLPAAFEQLSALVTQPDLFHQSLWALASFTSVLSSDAIAKFSSLYHQRLE